MNKDYDPISGFTQYTNVTDRKHIIRQIVSRSNDMTTFKEKIMSLYDFVAKNTKKQVMFFTYLENREMAY